jgi:hypothetical protein
VAKAATARKSAQSKAAGKARAKAKALPRKRAPQDKTKAASTQLQSVLTRPAADLAQEQPKAEPQFSHRDFRMSIDDMEPARLRAYARHLGILQRDVDGLTEDRLRQNCKARVFAALED